MDDLRAMEPIYDICIEIGTLARYRRAEGLLHGSPSICCRSGAKKDPLTLVACVLGSYRHRPKRGPWGPLGCFRSYSEWVAISGPSCPSNQNGWFGSHFEPFLLQAAQVVKMDDLRAMGPMYVWRLAPWRDAVLSFSFTFFHFLSFRFIFLHFLSFWSFTYIGSIWGPFFHKNGSNIRKGSKWEKMKENEGKWKEMRESER